MAREVRIFFNVQSIGDVVMYMENEYLRYIYITEGIFVRHIACSNESGRMEIVEECLARIDVYWKFSQGFSIHLSIAIVSYIMSVHHI